MHRHSHKPLPCFNRGTLCSRWPCSTHPSTKFNDSQSRLLEGHDIALVVLKEPIEIPENAFIPLAGKREVKIKNGNSLEVVGIGVDESGWPYGRPKISKTEIDKIPFWKCGGNAKKSFSAKDVVRVGDSGGAAFGAGKDGKPVQVGVTSSRMIFDYENEYLPPDKQKEVDCENKSVFMKSKDFLGWIEKETGYDPDKSHDQITHELKSRFNLNEKIKTSSHGCHGESIQKNDSLEKFLGQLDDVVSKLSEKCSVELLVASPNLTEKKIDKLLKDKAYSVNGEGKPSYKLEIVEGEETISVRLKTAEGKNIYSSTVKMELLERGGGKDFLSNLPLCRH